MGHKMVGGAWYPSTDRRAGVGLFGRTGAGRRGTGLYVEFHPCLPDTDWIARLTERGVSLDTFFHGDIGVNVQCPCGKWSGEKNGKEQCFATGPLHSGNPDTNLQMSSFSDYLGLLLTWGTMAFMTRS